MPSTDFATVEGFIQFPVQERETNNNTVRDITIRTTGIEGRLIKITVWPQFAHVEFDEGDWVSVDGDYRVTEKGDKTYVDMNAKKLAVVRAAEAGEREVVGQKRSF